MSCSSFGTSSCHKNGWTVRLWIQNQLGASLTYWIKKNYLVSKFYFIVWEIEIEETKRKIKKERKESINWVYYYGWFNKFTELVLFLNFMTSLIKLAGACDSKRLSIFLYKFLSFHFFLSGSTPCVIHVFNLSLPHEWSRTNLHTNGSFLREHYSFRKSKMVKLAFTISLIFRLLVVNRVLLLKIHTCRYLDVARQKNSNLYVCNGIALFLGWLVWSYIVMVLVFFNC